MNYHWCAEWYTGTTLHVFFFSAGSREEAHEIVRTWCEEPCTIPANAYLQFQPPCWSVTWLDSQQRKHWLILHGPQAVDKAREATLAWAGERRASVGTAQQISAMSLASLSSFDARQGQPFYEDQQEGEQQP